MKYLNHNCQVVATNKAVCHYIDGLIAVETDTDDFGVTGSPDGDFSDSVIQYALTDRLYSVIGLVDITGDLVERVRYTAYGEPRVEQRADITGDGLINASDQSLLLVNWNAAIGDPAPSNPPYNPDVDLNQDGVINGSDLSVLLINWGAAPNPRGVLSNQGNTVGYDGYLYDNAVNLSLARNRWLDHGTGRWVSRDPFDYIDGSSLYQYGRSSPIRYTDWRGASSAGVVGHLTNIAKCLAWAKKEATKDNSWVSKLSPCPCKLDTSDKNNPKVPCGSEGKWKKVEDSGKWKPYHPNATYQVRGKPNKNGNGQQCTYDGKGKLITGGSSAGTPDESSPDYVYTDLFFGPIKTVFTHIVPGDQGRHASGYLVNNSVGRHQKLDVFPFKACNDAGMLDTYFKYRQPSQGKKHNPYTPNIR